MKNYYLKMDLFLCIKNLQKLFTEIYRVANGLCPKIMNEVLQLQIQNHRNLRNNSTFRIPLFNTIFKGKESVSYLGQKIWSQVPGKIKTLDRLKNLKSNQEMGTTNGSMQALQNFLKWCWIHIIIPLILNIKCFCESCSISNIFVIFIFYFLFNLYFTLVDFNQHSVK